MREKDGKRGGLTARGERKRRRNRRNRWQKSCKKNVPFLNGIV